MVWAYNKIHTACKDDPTGHGTRRDKERQTEKEMGRKLSEWIGLGLDEALRKAEDREEWRKMVDRSSLMPYSYEGVSE